MKTITWKIKDSWIETKNDHPGEYTDYLLFHGWVKLSKLFPDIKPIYAIGGQLKGSHIYWHNFKACNFANTVWKQFFLRIDCGRWFVTITQPDPEHYRNVEIIA